MPFEKKFTDKEILDALKESMTMKEAGQKIGITSMGIRFRIMKMKKKAKLKNGKILNYDVLKKTK